MGQLCIKKPSDQTVLKEVLTKIENLQVLKKNLQKKCNLTRPAHSLIRGVLIQSCPTGAKNFTNYVFCHPQFSGVIQNIENRCAILTPVCLCRLLSK